MYCTCATNTFKSFKNTTQGICQINDSSHKHDFIGLPLVM